MEDGVGECYTCREHKEGEKTVTCGICKVSYHRSCTDLELFNGQPHEPISWMCSECEDAHKIDKIIYKKEIFKPAEGSPLLTPGYLEAWERNKDQESWRVKKTQPKRKKKSEDSDEEEEEEEDEEDEEEDDDDEEDDERRKKKAKKAKKKDEEDEEAKEQSSSAGEQANTKEREHLTIFLVKWQGRAYAHACWLTMKRVAEISKQRLTCFLNRWQAMSDREIEELEGTVAGIEPDALQVQRVIARRPPISTKKDTQPVEYLVKWLGLSYADCTWEKREDLEACSTTAIPEYERCLKNLQVRVCICICVCMLGVALRCLVAHLRGSWFCSASSLLSCSSLFTSIWCL